MRDPESVGLCFTCRWARVVTNRRGSVFYRCLRAETDPRFVRYPPLPVRQCDGYTPDTGTEDVERQRQAETSSDDVA
ncbi:MAG: hypothetical protein ACREMV_11630 [Gemmatimonadales bacterium]